MKRKNLLQVLSLLLLLFFGSQKSGAQTLAFPGAEGAGKYVSGGRGTKLFPTTVFEVTNLNDDNNPGSLRYALSQPSAVYPFRTIVFKVSGTILLTQGLDIPSNTTLAGQSAPGDGICIADHPVYIKGDNVILRYMRFRMGDRYQNIGKVAGSGSDDALGSTSGSKLIIDHCSVSWSEDEALSVYRGDSVTLQWNLISEPLNYSYHFEEQDTDFEQHGYGGIWGAINGSFHHNLFAHCRNRTPRFAGGDTYESGKSETCDFRNNVLYNWGINNIYGGDGGHYNVVNNYYKYGPNTSNVRKYQVVNVDSVSPTVQWARYFLKGNYIDGSPTNTSSNFLGVGMGNWTLKDTLKFKANVPFNLPDTIGESALSAYTNVLAQVGCSFPKRDTLDERIINDVKNRTGRFIDVQGGFPHGTDYSVSYIAWPALSSAPSPADSDHDGMPDSWESANGLNPNSATDGNNKNSLGYSNLEVYLNALITGASPNDPGYGGLNTTTVDTDTGSGDAASAVWNLTANTSATATGAISATDQVYPSSMTAGYVSYTSTGGLYANQTVNAQRVKPSAGWPASQAGPDDAQYVNYSITPGTYQKFTLDTLVFDFGDAGSTNTMKADIYYSLDEFSTEKLLINPQPITLPKYTVAGEFARFTFAGLGIAVPAGKTLSVRVYPWWPSGATTTKYLVERNVRMVGRTETVLPLKLLSFTAQLSSLPGALPVLKWETSNEVNCSHFLIERGYSSDSFQTIGRIDARNTSGSNSYAYQESGDCSGQLLYYRLKMVDLDGKYTYSKVIAVDAGSMSSAISISPNPARDRLSVIHPKAAGASGIKVISLGGAEVLRKRLTPGSTESEVDIQALPAGSYYLIFDGPAGRSVKQFIKY